MRIILRYNDILSTYKTRSYRLNYLSQYKSIFPIRANKLFAGLVGDLMGDGHLQGDPKWRIDFTSSSLNGLEDFGDRIKRILPGLITKIRKNHHNTFSESYNLGVNSSFLARVFFLLGVPSGQKVIKSFKIPEWIRVNKECFREFCKRLFSCEGSIMQEEKRKIPQIRAELWKQESRIDNGKLFMEDISFLMKKYFLIDSTVTLPKSKSIRKDNLITRPVRIYLFGESVLKFYNEIGFGNEKQKRLKALINM
jgi:hypothetical protein